MHCGKSHNNAKYALTYAENIMSFLHFCLQASNSIGEFNAKSRNGGLMQILMTVAYDGTGYCGWQWQKNAMSVQQKLEEALSGVFGKAFRVTGASRTDAGVHALGQRACFTIDDLRIPLEKLPIVINSFLPDDISVTDAVTVPEEFSPRFNAKEKTYLYQIWHDRFPNPLVRRTSAFFPHNLDLAKMARAAKDFEGEHDFAAFCASGSSAKTTVRTVHECKVMEEGQLIRITVRGNAFLYNMVRIMAGTLIYVGMSKISEYGVPEILASKRRDRAGKTAPACGLTLLCINY
jgi:tRNA pseudouridine38-40 synthase